MSQAAHLCPNCRHLHENVDFNAHPGPLQREIARKERVVADLLDVLEALKPGSTASTGPLIRLLRQI